MKKYLTLMLVLAAALCLASTAYADVIIGPAEVAVLYTVKFLPWILVGAVVVITALLLRKFRKK